MKKWILLFLIFWSGNSFGTIYGDDFLQGCNYATKVMDNNARPTDMYNTSDQMTGFGLCTGLIEGVADTLIITNNKLFCNTANTNYDQYLRVVTKYLNDHPEKLKLPAATLTILALQQAFPCSKTGK